MLKSYTNLIIYIHILNSLKYFLFTTHSKLCLLFYFILIFLLTINIHTARSYAIEYKSQLLFAICTYTQHSHKTGARTYSDPASLFLYSIIRLCCTNGSSLQNVNFAHLKVSSILHKMQEMITMKHNSICKII